MNQREQFLRQNLEQLAQAKRLLEAISDQAYSLTGHQYFGSGIGKHLRHVLDHYECFLGAEGDRVDYDLRSRDPRIETDRTCALKRIDEIAEGLEAISGRAGRGVEVRANESSEPGQHGQFCESSDARELSYLASHTVHHFALIAIILKILGIIPPEDFGVAPSTLSYLKRRQTG